VRGRRLAADAGVTDSISSRLAEGQLLHFRIETSENTAVGLVSTRVNEQWIDPNGMRLPAQVGQDREYATVVVGCLVEV
jgi:hypothetical protein